MAYVLLGYNTINGTAAAERIVGTAFRDAIYGNGGADTLNGGLGSDILFGGSAGGVTFEYTADATWLPTFRANNTGDPSGAGPGTSFDLSGYGQSQDVFVGAGANNTLKMADGKNALFLEDSLSLAADVVRLVNIQTINLGSGGQLVDLTSTTRSYGNVTINGGSGDDVIMSNAGADTLSGGDGADYIWGGSGNDTINGGSGADRLFGATGDDRLDGGAGADAMTGGAGNDTYVVDDVADTVIESSAQGTDQVWSSITHTLAANVENLVLTGTAAINGTGNALDNTITGNAANNRLEGGGGKDVLIGGLGNDTYVVENVGDVITELSGQGTDDVWSNVTYTLAANIENLTLTGNGALSGTGNALDNIITGNGAANTLTGGAGNDTLNGGTARDIMVGGIGNDTYVVDIAADVTTELAGEGTDLVLSAVTNTLQANVENLTLTGTAAVNGTGNALDNLIVGNAANNSLFGLDGLDKINAGAGNDTIDGGNGNDQLFGEDGNDSIVGGEGNDLLNGGFGLDVLRGGNGNDGFFGGGSNDTIYGDAGNDNIYGDNGNDLIFGGAGNDLLAGGQLKNGFSLGNDTFSWLRADVVNASGAKQGFDHIVDFGAGDKLDFSGLSLGAGPIASVIKVVDTSAGTVVSANFGGSVGFVDVVVLDGVHHMTLNDMVVDHAIVV